MRVRINLHLEVCQGAFVEFDESVPEYLIPQVGDEVTFPTTGKVHVIGRAIDYATGNTKIDIWACTKAQMEEKQKSIVR